MTRVLPTLRKRQRCSTCAPNVGGWRSRNSRFGATTAELGVLSTSRIFATPRRSWRLPSRLPAHAVLDEQRIETVGNSSRERRPRIDRELHRCPIDENAPLLPIRSPKAESLQRILQIGESSSSVAG